MLRLIRFALYRCMGFSRTTAARKAGYAEASIRGSEFLDSLERRAAEEGIVADIELPFTQLLQTQVSKNFATLIHLRDHGKSEKVRADAAKHLLALAGHSPQTAVKSELADETMKEFDTWSRAEQDHYLATGQVPRRLELPPGQEVQEQPVEDDEDAHPDRGMLA